MPNVERLILRMEFDKDTGKANILACFPDDHVNYGNIGAVPMHFKGDMTFFEPYTEVCPSYYYGNTKPVKDAELEEKCKCELEKRYSRDGSPVEFRIVRKITKRVKWA